MREHGHADRTGYGAVSFQINRKDITRARQAAEALFAPKPPLTEPAAKDPLVAGDQRKRKPRVLSAIPVQPTRLEPAKQSVEREPATPCHQLPASHLSRVRTWLKYGMTIRQAAEVYGVSVGEIERILRGA
jgi:hypothetical protein